LTSRPDEPRFTQPLRQIAIMLMVCGLVGLGTFLVWPSIEPVITANTYLNGTIAFVFFIGVLACFWQVVQLFSAISWIERIANGADESQGKPPLLLAALTGIFQVRGSRLQLTSASARSVLDSVGARMEEARDITRYITSLLIFLGLLGTFYGLAVTVPAVVDTIRSLQPTADDSGIEVFGRLMGGLESQLGGMGTAFASSLLGLAGSLVVGLLELFAGHGQNRFYREMEEWLSTVTRVSFSSGEGDGGGLDRAAIATVLDHMVDQIDTLQGLFSQSEARHAETEARLGEVTGVLSDLAERLGPGQVAATERLSAAQERLAEVLADASGESGIDAESRMRLRSIDVQLLKLYEELGSSRQDDLGALRQDLGALTTALQDLTRSASQPRQQRPVRRRPAPATGAAEDPPQET